VALDVDHLFIVVPPGGIEGDQLVALGLREGSPNVHPGQGTRNRRFFFFNAMLELIWIENERDARSDLVAPTRLWERSRASETGASPFGVCLRTADEISFETWRYTPPYLPPGIAIEIATGTAASEPMLFITPVNTSPDAVPPDRREPLEHPAGLRELTAVGITVTGSEPLSSPLRTVQRLGIATFGRGSAPLLELTFDRGRARRSADLRPVLPLVLQW
jgi:hypothetical protein